MRRMQLTPLALPQKTVAAQLRGGGPLAAVWRRRCSCPRLREG